MDKENLTPSAGRYFYTASMLIALGIGALQMYRVRGGIITNYGADLFGTAWLYAMFRQGKALGQRGRVLRPEMAALLVFVGCAGSEFAQKFHLIPGTYDPLDLLAYAFSVVVCYGIDRLLTPLA